MQIINTILSTVGKSIFRYFAVVEPVEVSAVRKSPMVVSILRQAQQPQAQSPKSLVGEARWLSLSKPPASLAFFISLSSTDSLNIQTLLPLKAKQDTALGYNYITS